MDTALSPHTIERRRRLTLLAGAAAVATVCASAWAINHVVRPGLDASEIRLTTVRRGDIASTISASGVVIPLHEEQVTSPVQSRVARVHAKAGQRVAAGDLLLELDAHAITLAVDSLKEQLAQQENRIASLALELDQKRKLIASAIELLELDLQSARVKRERYTTLRKAGGVSGEDMMTAELNVSRVEIQLRQQRELIEDTRKATASSTEGARLQKSILQKQLAVQQDLLARTRVSAPFGGVLTMLLEEEGASVNLGQLVARVSEPDNFRIEATVSDFHARSIHPGQAVRVDHDQEALTGRVQTILPEVQNGAIKLIVLLDQPHHPLLRNKMRVDVNIIASQAKGALVADAGPAFNGKGMQPAWIVRDGVAHKTMVTFGGGDGKQVQVLAGAREQDRLIASDTSNFKQHDTIRIND